MLITRGCRIHNKKYIVGTIPEVHEDTSVRKRIAAYNKIIWDKAPKYGYHIANLSDTDFQNSKGVSEAWHNSIIELYSESTP